MNKKKLLSPSVLIIVVLIVTAVVLGVLIYQQGSLSKLTGVLPFNKADQKATPQGGGEEEVADNRETRVLPSGLSSDEEALLNFPGPNDSDAVKRQHFDVAKKLAKPASVLELNKCSKPTPLVIQLTEGQEFTISNNDSVSHKFEINKDFSYDIKANSSQTFTAEFTHGPGLYGYGCDGKGGSVGAIYLVAK